MIERVFTRYALIAAATTLLVACGDDSTRTDVDAGIDSGPGMTDSGIDSGVDGGPMVMDAGSDGGPIVMDGAVEDAAVTDAAMGDAAVEDAAMEDAAVMDAGMMDGGDVPASCSDGVLNGDETDVDCGGPTCAARCEGGDTCVGATDCDSQLCIIGECLPSSCSDNIQNQDETSVDCGGVCDAMMTCPAGGACDDDNDCVAGLSCDAAGECRAASCSDGFTNDTETDVDCGGDCAPCTEGQLCLDGTDCDSGACPDGTCGPATCADGMLNGTETDIDCGGGVCNPCADGGSCNAGTDCDSARCEMDGAGAMICASCTDMILTGDEVGIDCAAPGSMSGCGLCPAGIECMDAAECASDRCESDMTAGTVVCATCDDGIQTGTEVDVDCGGDDCDACTAGATCMVAADCESGRCEGAAGSMVCNTCDDGVMNGDEIHVDCGGTTSGCGGCADGLSCTDAADCASGRCEGMVCNSCADGVMNGDEVDVDCGNGGLSGCLPCATGQMCNTNSDCESQLCQPDNTCAAPYYREDFEANAGGWIADAVWEHGTPAQTTIAAAAGGMNAWMTGLALDYPNNSSASVSSPRIDLSSATVDPVIQLDLFTVSDSTIDDLDIQMSLDRGMTWENLVGGPSAVGWTADGEFDSTENGTAWTTISTLMTGAAGVADVRVRFIISTSGVGTDEGWAFDNILVRNPGPGDLDVALSAGCGGVFATVQNLGEAPVSTYDIVSDVDGTMATTNVTDALAPGASASFYFAGTDVSVTATSTDDVTPANNTAMIAGAADMTPVVAVGAMGFNTDFEADGGPFTATAPWEHGAPTTAMAAGATGSAWVTTLAGNYPNSQNGFVTSDCFDIGAVGEDVALGFSLTYETESCCDEGWVDFSLDGGTTWQRLGTADDTNWYNDATNQWWDGSSSGWGPRANVIPGSGTAQMLRVRFGFSSDGSINAEGFGVDNLSLTRATGNLVVSATPVCGGVEATITNAGFQPIPAFDIVTDVDGTMATENVMMALAPGASITRSIPGNAVTVTVSADPMFEANTADNSVATMATPTVVLTPMMGYTEDFESGDGMFVGTGDWEYGTPSGAMATGAMGNIWGTVLAGDYTNGGPDTLTSVCLDASALATDAVLSFDTFRQVENCCDEGWIEFSLDSGATWSKLGLATDANWYNDTFSNWWDDNTPWTTYSHVIPGSAGVSELRVRVVFNPDGSVTDVGWGIDNIAVQ